MKTFVISDRKDKDTLSRVQLFIDEFKKAGIRVDDSQVNRTSEQDAENFEEAYKRNMKAIKESDFLIAEVSNLSSGIGYLISTALNLKKPVLALFYKKSTIKPSTMIKGSQSNKLVYYYEYDKSDISDVTGKFLDHVKKIMDTKFILIISSQIDRYLEWASNDKRMHKAQIVRNAVEEMMGRDKEWKSFKSGQ